jgi:predicted RNase H-like nuclease
VRFLGVDLAWKVENPSGAMLLGGRGFPLHLRETPRTLPSHRDVLDWIACQVQYHRSVVGVDAPLLGTERPGRRGCDNLISRVFGAFHASTHSPPRRPDLARFTGELLDRYGLESFGPRFRPASGRPAVREVYPNALQVHLFHLGRGARIRKYKRRRFGSNRQWVAEGLGPFVRACAHVVVDRYVVPDAEWRRFVAVVPKGSMSARELKAIEDRWDALLCALAVALEVLEPGSMAFYPGESWDRGAILAPAVREPAVAPMGAAAAGE